jgi:CRISPR-associated protein Cmr1
METIKFECEVITPMFLGGADGKSAELRAPSIKGALRFWWRAMNGHLPLKELHEREAEIFGGSGDKQGRSKVIVRVVPVSIKKSSSPLSGKIAENPSWYRTDIRADVLRYLTLGTFAMGENHGNHEYFEPSSKFNVAFSFIASNYQKEINLAFHLLSSFGGLGSKSRNGLGSFSILSDNKNAEKIQIKSQTIPDFSAFSKNSKLFQTKKGFRKLK